MTMGAAIVDRFRRVGFDDAQAIERATQLGEVERVWRARIGGEATTTWWVPGRLEVMGKHTDYAGGRALVAAVPRGFALMARPRPDAVVHVIDARYGDEVIVPVHPDGEAPRGWGNYVNAVVSRLASNFPGASLGADIVIANDLPRAAGVSSSSAFIVGLASVLVDVAAIETRDEWRAAVVTPIDRATYFGCMENGASFGALAGSRGVGTEGGSEDHTAIVLGQPGRLSQFEFVPARFRGDVAVNPEWTFVVAASGVHASKAGEVKDQFNRASRSAKAVLEVWRQRTSRDDQSLGAALGSAVDAPNRLRQWLAEDARIAGFSCAELAQRFEHFVNETTRVAMIAEAFAAGDGRRVGECAAASQDDAHTLLGNQVAETIALAESAREVGAVAASSFGAGFGGSVWALVARTDAARFGRQWLSHYLHKHPQPKEPDWFVSPPSPAATRIE